MLFLRVTGPQVTSHLVAFLKGNCTQTGDGPGGLALGCLRQAARRTFCRPFANAPEIARSICRYCATLLMSVPESWKVLPAGNSFVSTMSMWSQVIADWELGLFNLYNQVSDRRWCAHCFSKCARRVRAISHLPILPVDFHACLHFMCTRWMRSS